MRADLLKRFLPGLLPLVVFILADEIWGTRVSLLVAVAFGIGQLAFLGLRERRLDRFTLLDTGLIAVLGAVSYLLGNDVFFKLKPGMIGIILCAILGLSAFSRWDIMGTMAQRFAQGMPLQGSQAAQFRRRVRILFFLFAAHTALVFYAAFFLSKEVWAFLSTVVFYAIFLGYFLFEFGRARLRAARMRTSKEEWLPIVDEQGKVIGKAPRSVCHRGDRLLHPVVHLHVIRNAGRSIFLQKRPASKQIQPGKWDTAVGGHVSFGESLETALAREAREEAGLTGFQARLISRYVWDSQVERELVYLFLTDTPQDPVVDASEVDEGRFWAVEEVQAALGKGILTPNFEGEFRALMQLGLLAPAPVSSSRS
ncbi:MAG: NUDIX domain-containing protein [Candidatus Eisenbacteria bacterium]|nr:NUDIX domain-containing protein [Candidatus Eisenbacteria bacterium]